MSQVSHRCFVALAGGRQLAQIQKLDHGKIECYRECAQPGAGASSAAEHSISLYVPQTICSRRVSTSIHNWPTVYRSEEGQPKIGATSLITCYSRCHLGRLHRMVRSAISFVSKTYGTRHMGIEIFLSSRCAVSLRITDLYLILEYISYLFILKSILSRLYYPQSAYMTKLCLYCIKRMCKKDTLRRRNDIRTSLERTKGSWRAKRYCSFGGSDSYCVELDTSNLSQKPYTVKHEIYFLTAP